MTTHRKVLLLPVVEEKVVTVRVRAQAPEGIPDGKLPLLAVRLRDGVGKFLVNLGVVEDQPVGGWDGKLGFSGQPYINIPTRVFSIELSAVGPKADILEHALSANACVSLPAPWGGDAAVTFLGRQNERRLRVVGVPPGVTPDFLKRALTGANIDVRKISYIDGAGGFPYLNAMELVVVAEDKNIPSELALSDGSDRKMRVDLIADVLPPFPDGLVAEVTDQSDMQLEKLVRPVPNKPREYRSYRDAAGHQLQVQVTTERAPRQRASRPAVPSRPSKPDAPVSAPAPTGPPQPPAVDEQGFQPVTNRRGKNKRSASDRVPQQLVISTRATAARSKADTDSQQPSGAAPKPAVAPSGSSIASELPPAGADLPDALDTDATPMLTDAE